MTTDDVAVTIVVPVFNRNESLRRTIAGILAQSDRVSVVIVDDGSSPEFAAAVDNVAALGPIDVVHQANRGPAAARNAALDHTRSPFVMFVDSDDALAEGALAVIDRHLACRGDIGMVCGAVRIDMPGRPATTVYPDVLRGAPWGKLGVLPGSFVVRSDIVRAVGGYDEALRFGENTDLILRLAEECRRRSLALVATEDVLCVHHKDVSDERRYDAKRVDAAIHLLRRGRFDLAASDQRARLHAIAAVNAARIGRYTMSVKHAGLAVFTEPRKPHHLLRLAFSLTGPLARRRWLRNDRGTAGSL